MVLLKRFARIYVLSIALALSACTTPGINLDYSDNDTREKNADIPRPKSDKFAGDIRKRPRPNTKDQKEAPLIPVSKTEILGQSKNALTKILGKPNFTRSDHPAEIWRYRDKSCILNIYFYQSLKAADSKAFLVNYIEASTLQGRRTETSSCLNNIQQKLQKIY
ncbi:MAG: hypothetical protein CMF45_00180 [Legionellales bacterium]|nr:hypothetical protein [Legionellales bacterium]|tara:strand:+ start:400 stop:891 length:492 start_codon:yes stop_codon:yes gene_type:complete